MGDAQISALANGFGSILVSSGFRVQAYLPEQTSDDENLYVPVDCHACKQTHLINPAIGNALGEALAEE
jgi:hypothetical protein